MEKTKRQKLPRYRRTSSAPPMRLTERDKRIIEAVHAYDGLLSFSQIQRMFFTGVSQAKERLKLLYHHQYLNRPNKEQRLRLPEMVYWLDRRGAELVASFSGSSPVEFKWRREPRWFQVEHDIAVNDFRLELEQACSSENKIDLEMWVPESEFWSHPDKVSYKLRDGERKRFIRPDGFFMLSTAQFNLRYLLEIDRSTEDNPRIYREKILPGLAYLKSDAYQERFGHRSGRWLVVTTGERRLRNMLSQARSAGAKGLFYFSTYDRVSAKTMLFEPIWSRADRDDLVPMIFMDE